MKEERAKSCGVDFAERFVSNLVNLHRRRLGLRVCLRLSFFLELLFAQHECNEGGCQQQASELRGGCGLWPGQATVN